MILVVLIFALIIALYFIYRGGFKKITIQCINLITGAPKTGKSLLCADLVTRTYKKIHCQWWIKTHIFRKDVEEPLLYTNVLFSFKNIKNRDINPEYRRKAHRLDKNIRLLETDVLKRQKRIAYGSVVYIQEASLTSDNQDYLDNVVNILQSLYNKLFGHMSKGGIMFYDTQNVLDCHYAIKRCTSSFQWIMKSRNFFFFRILYIRELINNESVSSSQNNFNEDVDLSVRRYIVWRWCYKRYDRYYFSYMTDDLPVSDITYDSTKKEIVSFNPLYISASHNANEKELRDLDNERTLNKAIRFYSEKLVAKEKYEKQKAKEEYERKKAKENEEKKGESEK